MEEKFRLSPDESAQKKVSDTRSEVIKKEEDIEKILSAKSPELTPYKEFGLSQSDKKSLEKLQKEINTLKDEAKEYIDNLPLPDQRKEKYKDRIDEKNMDQEKEQKDFFEKEGIKDKFNQEARIETKSYEDNTIQESRFLSKGVNKDNDKDER